MQYMTSVFVLHAFLKPFRVNFTSVYLCPVVFSALKTEAKNHTHALTSSRIEWCRFLATHHVIIVEKGTWIEESFGFLRHSKSSSGSLRLRNTHFLCHPSLNKNDMRSVHFAHYAKGTFSIYGLKEALNSCLVIILFCLLGQTPLLLSPDWLKKEGFLPCNDDTQQLAVVIMHDVIKNARLRCQSLPADNWKKEHLPW